MADHGGRRAPGLRPLHLPRRRHDALTALLPILLPTSPAPAATPPGAAAPAEPAHDYVELLTAVPPRVLAYAAILLVVGAAIWRLWVLPRASAAAAADPEAFARARRAVALTGALGATAGLVAAAWQLAIQMGTLGDDLREMLGPVLAHTAWGRALVAQTAAFGVAAIAAWAAWRGERRSGTRAPGTGTYRVVAAAGVAAAAAQSGLGHAAADELAPLVAHLTAAAHVIGVAAWLGTLGVLAVVWIALAEPPADPVEVLLAPVAAPADTPWTIAAARPLAATMPGAAPARTLADLALEEVVGAGRVTPLTSDALHRDHTAGDGAPTEAAHRFPSAALVAPQVAAFSRVALAGAGLAALSGAVNAWLRLAGADNAATAASRLAALTGSRYGWILTAKLVLVAGVAAFGAVNWRRNTPRLATAGGTRALARHARLELGVAVAVLVLSAALALTSPPGTE